MKRMKKKESCGHTRKKRYKILADLTQNTNLTKKLLLFHYKNKVNKLISEYHQI